jgi:hypothetical protein
MAAAGGGTVAPPMAGVEAKKMVVGFNHNIKHKGKMYHIQTEDSGLENTSSSAGTSSRARRPPTPTSSARRTSPRSSAS